MAFSVNKVCQFLHAPTTLHLVVVKRILRYVNGTLKLGLMIKPDKSILVSAFSYAIGLAMLMTGDRPVALLFIFVVTWCHGARRNKPHCQGQVPCVSIRHWRMQRLK
jgi:hypothetical protein